MIPVGTGFQFRTTRTMAIPEDPLDSTTPGLPPREPAGVKETVHEFVREILEYLRLRCALVALEAAAAGGHFGRVALAAAVVLLGSALAYVTGWVVVVLWVARRWAGGDVIPPLAAMAGLHLAAAVAAGWWLVARSRKQALFPATRAELEEDRKWMHHPNR